VVVASRDTAADTVDTAADTKVSPPFSYQSSSVLTSESSRSETDARCVLGPHSCLDP